MTPYPEDQSRADDSKCLYNDCHSQARTEMTECIYGMLKQRFPIVKFIRAKLSNAIKIFQACAVLHNMAVEFRDEVPQAPHPNYREEVVADQPNDDNDVPQNQHHIVNMLNPRERREQGMNARDNWRRAMDPTPTQSEVRKIANHRVEAEIRRMTRR